MVRPWVMVVVALCVAGGLAILVVARRSPPAAATPRAAAVVAARPVAAPPPAAPAKSPADYLGVVIAEQEVDVAANLDGRLADVLVRVGDRVQRDAPLATLDLRTVQSDLAVARAEVKNARAMEAQARLGVADAEQRLERSAKLGALIPAADLEAARHERKLALAKLESAAAGVAEATARVAKLEVSRTDASVRAPFAGQVAARYLDPGALVHAQTPIVRLISSSALRVRFAVPEDEARGVAVGSPIRVRIPTLGAELGGAVETVAPEVDPAARMIFVEARLEDAPLGSRPPSGVAARVSVAR